MQSNIGRRVQIEGIEFRGLKVHANPDKNIPVVCNILYQYEWLAITIVLKYLHYQNPALMLIL